VPSSANAGVESSISTESRPEAAAPSALYMWVMLPTFCDRQPATAFRTSVRNRVAPSPR
jgi:hypothetical protein